MRSFRPERQRGFTLIELVVAAGILAVLALGIIPVAKVASVRADELELSRTLRTLRMAIDAYHEAAEAGEIDPDFIEPDHENYPPTSRRWWKGCPARGARTAGLRSSASSGVSRRTQ